MLQKKMKSGYTTGSCVVAAVKAIFMALYASEKSEMVELEALSGERIIAPIKSLVVKDDGGTASVIKDGGDDPDITHGTEIVTQLAIGSFSERVVFAAGVGVGTVTREGLSVPVGEPAINPGPRQMVRKIVEEYLPPGKSCKVTVTVPEGEKLARRTLNPVLGVEGGISIIGTSGIVRPMSEEGFKKSLTPQIDVALAAGFKSQVFVPGKIGENIAISLGLPERSIVQMSNFVGYMLEYAADHGLEDVLLFGHLGKLAKVAAGNMYTYNRISDARFETLVAYGAALGLSREGAKAILSCKTTEEAMPFIEKEGIAKDLYRLLCERATARSQRHVFDGLNIGTVMVTLKGEVLGMDENAKKIGEKLQWKLR